MNERDTLKSIYINNKIAYLSLVRMLRAGGNIAIYDIYDKLYTLESLIDGEDDGFPYSKNFMPDPDRMMDMLRKTTISVKKDKHRMILKRFFPADHILTDSISNHFTEKVRMQCEFNKFDTPIEAWNNRIRRMVKKKLEEGENLTYRGVFEYVYNDHHTRICNTFNEAYVQWIIKSIASKTGKGPSEIKLLDPSSGWGDRLIGSYAAGIAEYKGYDPNPQLTPLYGNIISHFGINNKMKAEILELPFEESDDRVNYYDIVFTSPPYFAYEIYGWSDGQSVTRYPEYDEWIKYMYRPYIRKAYEYLRKGGIIVIYIENIFMNGKKYDLNELTNEILAELGATMTTSYGLNVKYKLNRSNQTEKIKDTNSEELANNKRRTQYRYANSWIKPDETK